MEQLEPLVSQVLLDLLDLSDLLVPLETLG